MSNADTPELEVADIVPIDETQITEFLQSHPDFFDQNPTLLNQLEIPHQRGGAVSLVERQVASLRNENADLKQKLGTIIQLAEDNNRLLAKAKQLVLELMAAEDDAQLRRQVEGAIVENFNAGACRIWAYTADYPSIPALAQDPSSQILTRLEERKRSYCGLLKEADIDLLFEQNANKVGSAAIIPLLHEQKQLGLLAIANEDPDYYRDNMSTTLLDFIGDALALKMAQQSSEAKPV